MSTNLPESKVSTQYDGKPRRLYLRHCSGCNKPFYAPKHRNTKYCSRKCPSTVTALTLDCAFCRTPFKRNVGHLKKSKSGLRFCSRACKDKAQSIEGGISAIHPSHYKQGQYSYRKRAIAAFPSACNRCGYKKHVEILRVHHKDRNRNNNSTSNLEILCPNCHDTEHFMAGDGFFNKGKRPRFGAGDRN